MELSTTCYKLLPQLQTPPKELLSLVDLNARPVKNNVGYYAQRFLKNWNGRDFHAAQNIRVRFCQEYEDWVRDNIISAFNDASLNYVDSSNNKSSTGAHTDGTREYSLIYNIRVGGDSAKLCFWKEDGHDLIRPRATQGEDLSKLTLVESINGPYDCWYILNGRILHSVEDMTETRINLQVSLDANPWE